MKLSIPKSSYLLFFLFGCALIVGCEKENETGTNAVSTNIGEYNLLQESIDAIPYSNKNLIVFIDADMNEIEFTLTESEILNSNGARLYRYDVFEQGDTVIYYYRKEIKTFTAQNDALNISFEFSLESQPYKLDPESLGVADVLEIHYLIDQNPGNKSLLLRHEIDTRTYPESFNNSSIGQKEILGELFFDVFESDFGSPQSKIDFNLEFGMLSFTDNTGKLWRLKEII